MFPELTRDDDSFGSRPAVSGCAGRAWRMPMPSCARRGEKAVAEMTANIPHPYPPEAVDPFVFATRKGNALGEHLVLAITPRAKPNDLIGIIGALPQASGIPFVGYWLGTSHWGKGYATEAAQGLIDTLFSLVDIPAIDADTRVINPASRRVLEKCGFRAEGSAQVAAGAGRALPLRAVQARPLDLVGAEALARKRMGAAAEEPQMEAASGQAGRTLLGLRPRGCAESPRMGAGGAAISKRSRRSGRVPNAIRAERGQATAAPSGLSSSTEGMRPSNQKAAARATSPRRHGRRPRPDQSRQGQGCRAVALPCANSSMKWARPKRFGPCASASALEGGWDRRSRCRGRRRAAPSACRARPPILLAEPEPAEPFRKAAVQRRQRVPAGIGGDGGVEGAHAERRQHAVHELAARRMPEDADAGRRSRRLPAAHRARAGHGVEPLVARRDGAVLRDEEPLL